MFIAITAKFVINFITKNLILILSRTNIKTSETDFFKKVVELVLWFLFAALIFKIIGFSELALIMGGAFTAITSIIILKLTSDLFIDIIAGILILSDSNLKTGKRVKFRRIEGEIISIGIRKTKLRDCRRNIHIIPNHVIDKEVIILPDQD